MKKKRAKLITSIVLAAGFCALCVFSLGGISTNGKTFGVRGSGGVASDRVDDDQITGEINGAADGEEKDFEITDNSVAAEFSFTPIENSGECQVRITNKSSATKAVIPSTCEIDGKTYTVTEIPVNGFMNCENLVRVTLPKTVEKIGNTAFAYCPKLKYVNLNSVKEIGESAFASCSALETIFIPPTAKKIGERAFRKCTALKNVDLGRAEEIGRYMFENCSALETITIPPTVKKINDHAFCDCTALKNVDLGSVEEIGVYAFMSCYALETIIIPPTVNTIGAAAFAHCKSLSEIAIPETVSVMQRNVFGGCNVKVFVKADGAGEGWAEDWNICNENQDVVFGYKD